MIRTEIDLPTHIYHDVELMAKANKRPTAQVLRELIDMGIQRWRLRQTKENPRGVMQLADLNITGGPKDLARNVDKYLYGDDK